MQVTIGTSGWNYKDWKGIFYPKVTKEIEYLNFYSKKFDSVEINNTFYNIPRSDIVINWRKSVSKDFSFSVKANRYITHMFKLLNTEKVLNNFLTTIENLKNNLGPILFQMPPHLHSDTKRLSDFLDLLPNNHDYIFEFRHESWYTREVYNLLTKSNCALCIHDHKDAPSPVLTTTDFIYFRFHGPNGRYLSKYSDEDMKKQAEMINSVKNNVKQIYCYYNNDTGGYALENAKSLEHLVLKKY